jgi:hypothetical protein
MRLQPLIAGASAVLILVACVNSAPAARSPAPAVRATASSVLPSVSRQAAPAGSTAAPGQGTAGAVTAQALDTVIKLTWPPVAGATGYLVYRDGNAIPLTPQPVTGSTFEDIGLTNGRTYSYVVVAADPAGTPARRFAQVTAHPSAPTP